MQFASLNTAVAVVAAFEDVAVGSFAEAEADVVAVSVAAYVLLLIMNASSSASNDDETGFEETLQSIGDFMTSS